MKRIMLLSLFLIILLPLVGCIGGIASIDWVDFIKFNDITYLHENQSVSVNESDLSPYGVIKFKLADNVNNPNYRSKNGDAAFIEAGTPVYSLKGYSPYFRLVVKSDRGLLIYEADTNPKARKGSDLLDIEGKIQAIRIYSWYDGKTPPVLSITEETKINELVRMILEAPVNQGLLGTGSWTLSMEFLFKDGTTTRRAYWPDTQILSRGIQLPKEFKVE